MWYNRVCDMLSLPWNLAQQLGLLRQWLVWAPPQYAWRGGWAWSRPVSVWSWHRTSDTRINPTPQVCGRKILGPCSQRTIATPGFGQADLKQINQGEIVEKKYARTKAEILYKKLFEKCESIMEQQNRKRDSLGSVLYKHLKWEHRLAATSNQFCGLLSDNGFEDETEIWSSANYHTRIARNRS